MSSSSCSNLLDIKMKVKTNHFLSNRKTATNKLASKVIKKAISQKSSATSKMTTEQQFSCWRCNEIFRSRWYLVKHNCSFPLPEDQPSSNESDLKETVKCAVCHLKCQSKFDEKLHKIIHIGYKPYTCQTCNTTFENDEKWKMHSAKQSHCEECLQNFGCIFVLQRHVCIENNLTCFKCGMQFKKRIALLRHRATCKLRKECKICGKKFIRLGSLIKHIKLFHNLPNENVQEMLASDDLEENTANDEEDPIFKSSDNLSKEESVDEEKNVQFESEKNVQFESEKNVQFESETIHLNGPVKSLVLCRVESKKENGSRSTNKICEACNRVFKSSKAMKIHRKLYCLEDKESTLERKIVLPQDLKLRCRCNTCNKLTCFERVNLDGCKKCGDNCKCLETSTNDETVENLESDSALNLKLDESEGIEPSNSESITENVEEPVEENVASEVATFSFICMECKTQTQTGITDDFYCSKCHEIFDDEGIYNEHMDGHNILECSANYNIVDAEGDKIADPSSTCHICKSTFKSYRGLRLHQHHQHPEIKRMRDFEQISCLKCEKLCSCLQSFEFHQKTCYGNNNSTAESIELKRLQTTLTESSLLNVSGGGGSTECNKCLKVFRSSKLLELHEKQMHKEIKCSMCDAMFWKQEDLLSHTRTHASKRFQCEHCKASVESSMALRYHRMKHFGKRVQYDYRKGSANSVFMCHHCQMTFETFRKFEIHCKKLTLVSDGDKDVIVAKETPLVKKDVPESKQEGEDISTGDKIEFEEYTEEERLLLENEEAKYIEESKNVSDNNASSSSSSSSSSRIYSENGGASQSTFNQESDMRCNLGNLLQKAPETNSRGGSKVKSPSTSAKSSLDFTPTIPEDLGSEVCPEGQKGKIIGLLEDESSETFLQSTIATIENQERITPILITPKNNKIVHLAIRAMEHSLRSRECKSIHPVVKKLIKRVFATLIKERVSLTQPHMCLICSKVFVKPQGITNHYFRRHGSKGVIRALKMTQQNKLPPVDKELKKWPKTEINDDQSALPEQIGNDGLTVKYRKVEANVSPKDEPLLIELRNNFSSLLSHLVGDTEVLAELGWPQRLIDDVLVDVINRCESTPCVDARKSRLSRLRENITTLLSICVKEQAMENFGWYSKPVDEVVKEMLAGGEIGGS